MLPWLRKHKKQLGILSGAVILYALLCLYQLEVVSIWYDEAYSALLATFDPMTLVASTAHDVHPPFYYLILRLWVEVFGTSELGLRFLSTLFGAGVVVLSYFMARQVTTTKYVWIVPYLVAFSPMLVRYGREARMYTLLVFLVFLSIYLLLDALGSREKWRWRTHGVTVGLAILTHYLAVLYWAAQWLYASVRAFYGGERHIGRVIFPEGWRYSCIAVLLATSAWLPIMLATVIDKQVSGFWIPPFHLGRMVDTVTRTFTYEPVVQLPWWQVGLVAGLVGGGISAWWRYRKEFDDRMMLVGVSVFMPPFMLAMLSIPPLVSKYYDRYLMPSMILVSTMVILIGAWLLEKKTLSPRLMGIGVLTAYIMLSIIGVANVYYRGNYNEFDGRTATKEILWDIAHTRPDIPVYIGNPGVGLVAWYYRKDVPLMLSKLQDFDGHAEVDIKENIHQIQMNYKSADIWILDHVRPSRVSGFEVIWSYIPDEWQPREEIVYEEASDQPSYRAVRYTVR